MLPADTELQKEASRYGYWRRVGRKSKYIRYANLDSVYICMSNPEIRETSIEFFSREMNNFTNHRSSDNLLTNIIYVTVITACIVICFFGNFKY